MAHARALGPLAAPSATCTAYKLMDSNRVVTAQDVGGRHGWLQLGKHLPTLLLWGLPNGKRLAGCRAGLLLPLRCGESLS